MIGDIRTLGSRVLWHSSIVLAATPRVGLLVTSKILPASAVVQRHHVCVDDLR